MKPLLIYGSQDFGRVVRDLAEQCGYKVLGFIDDIHAGDGILGGFETVRGEHTPETCEIVIAIGYKHLSARRAVYQKVRQSGYSVPTLIHPRAYVRDPERIGEGCIIMANATVEVFATIGDLTVLWNGANVSHDTKVGANCFLSPSTTLCGFVEVGEHCFIGAGAVIVDRMQVPANSSIRAGSVYSPSKIDDPNVIRVLP
jgi:sugar O-acyltransferase (sialic acid O-acetyltransferase NeuD family)